MAACAKEAELQIEYGVLPGICSYWQETSRASLRLPYLAETGVIPDGIS
jgi:hypothetical protein